jgi:MHS family proline/betaine transporter-like MFS transporter
MLEQDSDHVIASGETPLQISQSPLRTALAGLIGNVLEWYDFAVYGYFAGDIGRQFFPLVSPAAQQLLAFAVFAIGFLRDR